MARAKPARSDVTVIFDGPPDAVEAYLAVDPSRRRDVRVSLAGQGGWEPVRALTAPAGDQILVRLVLPATVPAGETEGLVEVGDERYPAVVRTVGQVELTCSPASLELTADEGGTATTTLQVVNVGNVAVDVPDITAFGLMEEGGLEASIGAGLRSKEETGVDRFGRMADTLAERHGGLVRVTVKAEPARLEPGRSSVVELGFHLGTEASGRRRFHGVLPLSTLRIPVWLHAPESPPTSRATRATKKGAEG